VGLAAHDARPDQNWMFGAVFSTTLGVVLSKVFRMLATPLSRSFGSTRSAPVEEAELKAEALSLAVDSALDERTKLLDQNRSAWRRQSMRELVRAKSCYENAIAELEAARDALSGEATLIAWLDTGASAEAASDPLGGRVGVDATGRPAISFSRTLEELRQDAEHLAAHPVNRDDPQPRLRPELVTGARPKGWE
jgi:hypothetical protein